MKVTRIIMMMLRKTVENDDADNEEKEERICCVYSKDFVLETLIYQTDAEMWLLVWDVISGPLDGHPKEALYWLIILRL